MVISSDASAPLFVVIGATGLQGGSVVHHLASSPDAYRVRGLSRDKSKPKAEDLVAKGVEVMQCNISQEQAVHVKHAFEGATYIFVVTNFWEHLDGSRQIAEGELIVDCAAATTGVKLLLISSLPNVTKATGGELRKAVHFDAQAAAAKRARDLKLPFVEIQVAPYMNNFTTFQRPQPRGDGTYVVQSTWSPGTKHALLDTHHDFGLFVRLAVESPELSKGDGKVNSAYAEWLTLDEQAKAISKATGRTVVYEQISIDKYREIGAAMGLPAHVIDDMVDMNKFHEFYWERVFADTDLTQLARRPRSFLEYCQQEDWSSILI